ncbi:hypothetical protein R6Q59_006923 [Mikania micrantha]
MFKNQIHPSNWVNDAPVSNPKTLFNRSPTSCKQLITTSPDPPQKLTPPAFRRFYLTEVSTDASSCDSAFFEAWKKVAPSLQTWIHQQVVEVSTSKTGKHSHAKCHSVTIDIFNGRKHDDIVPSSDNCDVHHIRRADYCLLIFLRMDL